MHEVELVTRVIAAVQYDVADEPPASPDQPLGRRVYELIIAATLKALGVTANPDGCLPSLSVDGFPRFPPDVDDAVAVLRRRATGKTRRRK